MQPAAFSFTFTHFVFACLFFDPSIPNLAEGCRGDIEVDQTKGPKFKIKTTTLRMIWACSSLVVSLGGWPAISQDLSDSCEQQMAVTPKINQKVHVAAVLPCRCAHATVTGGFFNHILSAEKNKKVGGLEFSKFYLSNTSLPLATKRPNYSWSITCFCHATARKLSVQKVQLNFYATGSEIQAQLPKATLILIQCVTLIKTYNHMYIIYSNQKAYRLCLHSHMQSFPIKLPAKA